MKKDDDGLKSRKVSTSKEKHLREITSKKADFESSINNRMTLFLQVFESIADAYLIMDLGGNVLNMNKSAKDLLGYDVDKESLNVVDLIYKDDFKYAMESYAKLQNEGSFKNYEARIYTKNGDVKWIQINASLFYENNQPIAAQGIIRDISDSKKNIEIINDQKKELEIILNNNRSGILLSKSGKVLKANIAMCSMFGYEAIDFLKLTTKDLTFKDDFLESEDLIKRMDSGEIDHFEIFKRYIRKNGSIFWGRTNVNAVRNKDGDIDYTVSSVEDVTSQREKSLIIEVINDVAKSLLGKLDVYEIASEITSKIASYLNTDDCVMYRVDSKAKTLSQVAAFGEKKASDGSIINKLVLNIGEGIAGDVAKTGTAEIINDTSNDKRYIVDHKKRDSEICVPIKLNGKVIGIIDAEYEDKNHFTSEHLSTLESIANLVALQFNNAIQLYDLKIAQGQLMDSENWLTTIMNSLDIGILLETENRQVKNANKKLYELFNIELSPEEYVGSDLKEIVESEGRDAYADPDGFIKDLNALIENKIPVLGQEMLMSDGRVFVRDYIPIFEKEVCKGHLWTFKDITFMKKYEERLESERQKYSSILENMNLGIIETDIDGKILFVNQSFIEISGYPKEELLGRRGNDIFIKGDSQQKVREAIKNRKKGVSYSYEVKVENKKGELRHWLISGAPNYDDNNNIIGTIGAHLDITDLKNLENQKESLLNQLKRSNEELREYAHVVSHDLKSPLRGISALISWIKEDYQSVIGEEGLKNFDHIDNKIETMDSLIEGILSYSSISEINEPSEQVDLNNIIDDITKTIYIPDHVEVKLKRKLPIIHINDTRIRQVFQNLISNAVMHIDKDSGLVEVDYEDLGNFHQFKVSDNGVGIAKEYHAKIFEIFQSVSEKSSRSTGIGLSIVKKIVSLYQGKIWLDSEKGKGSSFYFTIKK